MPPKYFLDHQYLHHRESTTSRLDDFLERYQRECEEKTNQVVECECSICYEPLNSDFCSIPCKHEFHKSCLKKMSNDKCPLCRCDMGINCSSYEQPSRNERRHQIMMEHVNNLLLHMETIVNDERRMQGMRQHNIWMLRLGDLIEDRIFLIENGYHHDMMEDIEQRIDEILEEGRQFEWIWQFNS
jgi:Ring finger domain